jgi:hypothetical protein
VADRACEADGSTVPVQEAAHQRLALRQGLVERGVQGGADALAAPILVHPDLAEVLVLEQLDRPGRRFADAGVVVPGLEPEHAVVGGVAYLDRGHRTSILLTCRSAYGRGHEQ